MKLHFLLMLSLLSMSLLKGQKMTGLEVLAKSIQYHDPDGNWPKFDGQLHLKQTLATKKTGQNKVTIKNESSYFRQEQQYGQHTIVRIVKNGACSATLDGRTDFSEKEAKKFGLSCKNIEAYRNYFFYLYGLPMKLKDEGALLQEEVKEADFQGKTYYALKVTYEPEVGKDTWYFYFDKTTFAMEGYRFYRNESKNDGEYVTLTGVVVHQNIKIPKIRKWHYNKDDKFLGMDVLERVE